MDQIRETMISFAEDRGYIFWALVYLIVVVIVGFFEQLFYEGAILNYIDNYKFRFLLLAALAGSVFDYYVKANVEVTAVRNKFIFKPPIYLRNFRRWSNIALFLAFALTTYLTMRWPEYVYDSQLVKNYDINVERNRYVVKSFIHINSVLPLFTLLASFLLCLVWAFMGLFLSEDDMNDKRIRYFMEEVRVRRAKYFNRAGVIYIGGFFLASILFYKLIHVQGLWFYIWNSRIVYNSVTFFSQYFGWVNTFIK